MWMSNIAAAAMMLSALRPVLAGSARDDRLRRALLMAIALGANFGGIGTPVGSGPNAIAMSAATRETSITFFSWMVFAVPLTLGMLAAGLLLVVARFRVTGGTNVVAAPAPALGRRGWGVVIVFFATVIAWLCEPLHGAPSGVVALLAVAVLFGSRLLDRSDLGRIDWSTMGLIAGGIALGSLLDKSGLMRVVADGVPWTEVSPLARLMGLCFASALLSAVMSNTATAVMLIPLAASIDPSPSTAILIAVAASMGIPFAISTPPNAMVYGEGGLTQGDLFVIGVVLLLIGCVLISLTGPFVLNLAGIA